MSVCIFYILTVILESVEVIIVSSKGLPCEIVISLNPYCLRVMFSDLTRGAHAIISVPACIVIQLVRRASLQLTN